MRYVFTVVVILLAQVMLKSNILAQDTASQSADILIYQSGQILSINSTNGSNTSVMPIAVNPLVPSNLSAIWTEYDKISGHIYMIVEEGPFDLATGKQLRSVISVDSASQKTETLYTEYDLQGGAVSPDGTRLLIHQYRITDLSITPVGSRMCVLIIATRTCRIVELDGIANQFSWLDKSSNFMVVMNGLLYICSVNKLSCGSQPTTQEIYVQRAIPTHQPNQILIVTTLKQPDGTAHFYYYDTKTRRQVEIKQLRKAPVYSGGLGGDGLPIIQDYIEYVDLSTDGKYLILANWSPNFEIRDFSTGSQVMTFQGFYPQWLDDNRTFVDINVQGSLAEVYSMNIETRVRTALYTTNQPFNLIVP